MPIHGCSKQPQMIPLPPSPICFITILQYSGAGVLCLLLILKHQHIAILFHRNLFSSLKFTCCVTVYRVLTQILYIIIIMYIHQHLIKLHVLSHAQPGPPRRQQMICVHTIVGGGVVLDVCVCVHVRVLVTRIYMYACANTIT